MQISMKYSINSNQPSNIDGAQAKDSLLPNHESSNDGRPDDKKKDNDENLVSRMKRSSSCLDQPSTDDEAEANTGQTTNDGRPYCKKLKKVDNEDPIHQATGKFDDGKCAICLNSPQVDKSFPPCEHTFCFECLDQWCNVKNDCPTCKQEIQSFRHNNGKDVKHVQPKESNVAAERIAISQLVLTSLRHLLNQKRNERAKLIARRGMWPNNWIENQIRGLTSQIGVLIQALTGQLDI